MAETNVDTTAIRRALNVFYFTTAEARVERIPVGEDSENFLVASGDRKFVLKWFADIDRESIGEELAAMKWLNERGVPVPDVVEKQEGGLFAEVDGACVVLLEYIEGVAADDSFLSGLRIAGFLADFHAQSAEYTGEFCDNRSEIARLVAFESRCKENRAYLNVDGVRQFIDDYRSEVELFEAVLQRVGGELGIIHHDLHGDNFLVDGDSGEVKAILDFSEAHKGQLVFDLAVLLGYWALDREKACLDMEKCRQLLLAYDERRSIPASQMTLLPHAVLLYFATDATGYILPKLRNPEQFAISQCNMHEWFCMLREDREWMDELRTTKV